MRTVRRFTLRTCALVVGAALAGSMVLAPAPARAQEVVRIGYSGPLSGGAAQYGRNIQLGIEMAIKEINDDGFEVGGKKYRMELVSLDDKYSPADAAVNARRLIQQSKTPAIFVGHSGGIFAVQAFNQQEKTLLMAYTSVPKVTESGNKLSIRIPPDFTGYLKPFAAYEMGRFGKKLGMLPADHDYAKVWTTLMKNTWEAAGGTVVDSNPMSYNRATDFYSGVSKVVSAGPDVLFVGGASEPTALVIKQARELGFKGGFLVMDQAKMDEVAKVTGGFDMLEGSVGVLPIDNNPNEGSKAFVKKYRALQGADVVPTSESALNYAAMHALANAMIKAGTVTDTEKIRAAFSEAARTLKEEWNPYRFSGVSEKGGLESDVLAGVVEKGKIRHVPLQELGKTAR